MRNSLIILIAVACFTSCHKTAISLPNNWTWFGTDNAPVYNYVLINANQVTNKADSGEFHIGIDAAFIDSNNNRLTGIDNLLVNNMAINRNVDSTYSFDYGQQASLDQGLALYGTNVVITLKGNSDGDTVSKTVYLPKKLVGALSDFPDVADISKDLTLKWTVDPNSPWGHVIIQVFYYESLSLESDSTLPQHINTLNYTVPDIGTYVVREQDLQLFPVKSYIGISIARGTQSVVVLPISKKRVFYFSSSSASTPPLLVVHN